jgi:hypothetical protein
MACGAVGGFFSITGRKSDKVLKRVAMNVRGSTRKLHWCG